MPGLHLSGGQKALFSFVVYLLFNFVAVWMVISNLFFKTGEH